MIERCPSHITSGINIGGESIDNDDAQGYGYIYNGYALGLVRYNQPISGDWTKKVTPDGWRIPIWADYEDLRKGINSITRKGNALKQDRVQTVHYTQGANDINNRWIPVAQYNHPLWCCKWSFKLLPSPGYYTNTNNVGQSGFNAIPAGGIGMGQNYMNVGGVSVQALLMGGIFVMWLDVFEQYYPSSTRFLVLRYDDDDINLAIAQYKYCGATVRLCRHFNNDSNPGVVTIDGIDYPYKRIGNRHWTTVNLYTTKYSNGTDIPRANNVNEWHQYNADKQGCYMYPIHPSVQIIDMYYPVGRHALNP